MNYRSQRYPGILELTTTQWLAWGSKKLGSSTAPPDYLKCASSLKDIEKGGKGYIERHRKGRKGHIERHRKGRQGYAGTSHSRGNIPKGNIRFRNVSDNFYVVGAASQRRLILFKQKMIIPVLCNRKPR